MSAAIRRPRRRTLTLLVAGATIAALAVGLPAGAAVLSGSSLDASDGDMAGTTDWMQLAGHTAGFTSASGVVLQAIVNDEFKGSGTADTSFVNGTKEDDAPPALGTGGIPPNKDDFAHLYVASEHATAAETTTTARDFLYLGWTRTNNSGTAFESFEFNQNAITTANVPPTRSKDDVLVLYDLLNGGSTPDLHYSTWQMPALVCDNSKSVGLAGGCWGTRHPISTNDQASINSAALAG